jgi:serine/alanine adding enzyme
MSLRTTVNFTCLRASIEAEKEHWRRLWDVLPVHRRDAYFRPEYLLASEKAGLGRAMCAAAWKENAVWLYPFLLCTTPPDLAVDLQPSFDVIGAYGYGGPVVNAAGEDNEFLSSVWSEFRLWARANHVVGEFVRFHPLLENSRWAPSEIRVIPDRQTVPIDLNLYPGDWANSSYYRVHRNMVRKSEREGFVFKICTEPAKELNWFVPLYDDTQGFLNAGVETRFSQAYFETLIIGLGDNAWLGIVQKTDAIAAAVLVLDGETTSHCHLMGYRRLPKTAGLTNLIYHGIAFEAARRGKSILHMGGGRTGDEKDSLFKFKKSLSPKRALFEIGMQCHDTKTYALLGQKWEQAYGPRPKNYFLFYRLPGQSSMSSSSS